MLITDQDINMIQKLKNELSKMFDIKDLGNAKDIMEWRFYETKRQINYSYHRNDSNSVSTPFVGNLKWSKKPFLYIEKMLKFQLFYFH